MDTDNKDIEEIQLEVLNTIKDITHTLTIISLIKLANEFYSLGERKLLYEKCEKLYEYAKCERSKLLTKNDDQNAVGFNALKQANKNINEFNKEHPIIANIVRKKNTLIS